MQTADIGWGKRESETDRERLRTPDRILGI